MVTNKYSFEIETGIELPFIYFMYLEYQKLCTNLSGKMLIYASKCLNMPDNQRIETANTFNVKRI